MKSNRRQFFLIFLCWLLYMMAQLGRYSYSANTTLIIDAYGVSHAEAGLPTTFYFFAYGAGNIIVGLLCAKYNKRIAVTLALLVSVASNLCLFFGIDFGIVKYVWAANGFAQANLWPIMLLTLGQNLETKKMTFAALVMSTASYVGIFLAYGLSSLNLLLGINYTYIFLIGAVAMVAVGIMWFFSSGLIDEKTDKTVEVNEKKSASGFIVTTAVMLGAFMLFGLVAEAVSGGLKQWVPSILKENFGIEDWIAIFVTVALPLVSVATAFIATALYKLLKSFILSSAIMFVVAAALIPLVIKVLNASWPVIMVLFVTIYVAMGVISNQLSVQAPLYLKDRFNSGFLAGIINGACYIGTALGTYVLGVFADNEGWSGAFNLLFLVVLIAAVFALIYYLFTVRKKVKTTNQDNNNF